MNVALHKIIDELEKLGLKRGWTDADIVKYSYGDCKATFIIIWKKERRKAAPCPFRTPCL